MATVFSGTIDIIITELSSWQLVFDIERIADDKVIIFLPRSPEPWSGSVSLVTDDRVAPLNVTSQISSQPDETVLQGNHRYLTKRRLIQQSQIIKEGFKVNIL